MRDEHLHHITRLDHEGIDFLTQKINAERCNWHCYLSDFVSVTQKIKLLRAAMDRLYMALFIRIRFGLHPNIEKRPREKTHGKSARLWTLKSVVKWLPLTQ